MPTLTFPVLPDGLLVDVMIGLGGNHLQQFQARGIAIPRPIRVRGMMDTGTDLTACSTQIIQALGLQPSGSAGTYTAGGYVPVHYYEISLSILSPPGSALMYTTPQLVVTELLHLAPGVEVLVGLDVILQGVFNVDGPNRVFTFSF